MTLSLDDATTAYSRVFITGAAGFMGRALAERYRAAGVEVLGIDLYADDDAQIFIGDTTKPEEWAHRVSGCDLVVHTAALLNLTGDDDLYWNVNVLGTRNALDAAFTAGAHRFVHVSSITAFGFVYPDGVDEHWPPRTNGSPYVDTKVTSEQVVLASHARGEIPCTVVRPGDVYGPGSMPWTVLPLTGMKAGMAILGPDQNGTLSPVFIENLVDGLILAAATPEAAGEVLTVSDGTTVDTHRFMGYYAEALGCPPHPAGPPGCPDLPPADLDEFTAAYLTRSGGYSINRARSILGYEPRVSLDAGMDLTVAWLRQSGMLR